MRTHPSAAHADLWQGRVRSGAAGLAACLALTLVAAESAPPELPVAITSFGACVSDGWVYVYGGHAGAAHQYSLATTLFDFRRCRVDGSGGWESLPGPVRAQGASLLAHEGRLYLVGGMAARNEVRGEDEKLVSLRHVAAFDPSSQTWCKLPELPEPRSSHDSVVLEGKLYVVGGWELSGARRGRWAEHGLILDLERPESGWKEFRQPFQRRAIAAAAFDGRIYVIGGMDQEDDTSLEVDVYEPRTGEWTTGPRLPKGPMGGFGAAACVMDGRLFVTTYAGQLLELDLAADAWISVAELDTRRFFHRMVPAEPGTLWLIGGASRQSGHLNSVQCIVLSDTGI
jgi:N-acetylneuraminic acid mutarotase